MLLKLFLTDPKCKIFSVMKKESLEVFILKSVKVLGGKRIITAFSKEKGKVSFLVYDKGKDNKNGLLQPFTRLRIFVDNKKIPIVKEIDFLSLPPDFFDDLFFCLEVIILLSSENEKNEIYFELIEKLVKQENFQNIDLIFIIKSMKAFGILSSFYNCSSCGRKFYNDSFWQNGDLRCGNCFQTGDLLGFSQIKICNFYIKESVEISRKVDITQNDKNYLLNLFLSFLNDFYGIKFKTKKLYKK